MRVLYLEPGAVALDVLGATVDQPVLAGGRPLVARIEALHQALASPDDRLEAEVRLHAALEAVRATFGRLPDRASPVRSNELAEALRVPARGRGTRGTS